MNSYTVAGTRDRKKMSRAFTVLLAIAIANEAASRPVKKTLNFNMFLLSPRQDAPDRVFLTTDGISRFGPILEYLVQRVQGLMSVRVPPEQQDGLQANFDVTTAIPDPAENEIDGVQEARMPGVVVKPSLTKPGTYEVQINVLVDDGQPDDKQST